MQADILAEVYFKKTNEGGRATNIKGNAPDSSYGCSLFIANEGLECRLIIGKKLFELNKHYVMQIKLMRSNSAIGKLSINALPHNQFQRYGGDVYIYNTFLRTAIEAVSFLSFRISRSSLRREEKHCWD